MRLLEILRDGAEAVGFRGDLWTCHRVAWVIEAEFGVRYHPAHVSRILRPCGWSQPKPTLRVSAMKKRLSIGSRRANQEKKKPMRKAGQ